MKKDNQQGKIEVKFQNSKILYITLLVLCGCLFVILFIKLYSISKESIISSEYITIESTAKKVEYILQTYIDQVYECEAMVEEMISSGKSNEDILNYLAMEHDAIYLVAGEQYIDIYGYIRGEHLDGAYWEPPADYIPTERPWYLVAMENKGNISMAGPYVDAMTGSTVISYAVTLKNDNGVISYDVMLDDLQELISDLAGSKYECALLISDDNSILVDSDKKYGCMDIREVEDPLISAIYSGYSANPGEDYSFEYDNKSFYVYNMDVSFNMHFLVIGETNTMFPHLKNTIILGITLLAALVVIESFLVHSMNEHRRQIEKNFKHISELYQQAYTDKLTGIGNRRAYEDKKEEIESGGIKEDLIYVVFDLNGLKAVNDNAGHDAGDVFLRETAKLIKNAFEKYGFVFRTGGDEFVALLSVTKDEFEGAKTFFEQSIEEYNKNGEVQVSVSMGFSEFGPKENVGLVELARQADKMMYAQKALYYSESGRERRNI